MSASLLFYKGGIPTRVKLMYMECNSELELKASEQNAIHQLLVWGWRLSK